MRWPELTTLQWALALSLGAHGVLLTVRFVDPEAINRAFRDTPLEVILVNARGDEPPTEAQAIAQANLAGGGEAAKGRATSPLPLAATVQMGESPDEARQRIEQTIACNVIRRRAGDLVIDHRLAFTFQDGALQVVA